VSHGFRTPELVAHEGALYVADAVERGTGFSRTFDPFLKVYDLATPGEPRLVSTIAVPGSRMRHVLVHDDRLYVASSRLEVYGVSDPLHPVRRDDAPDVSYPTEMTATANHLFVSDSNETKIFDHDAQLLGSVGARGELAVFGDYLYVERGGDVSTWLVRNPAAPVPLGTVAEGSDMLGVFQGQLFLQDGDGLHGYDLSNPASPTLARTVDLGRYVRATDCGSFLCVSTWDRLSFIDLRGPGLTQVGAFGLPGRGYQGRAATYGPYYYVARRFELSAVRLCD
jgi:hypothetical protein